MTPNNPNDGNPQQTAFTTNTSHDNNIREFDLPQGELINENLQTTGSDVLDLDDTVGLSDDQDDKDNEGMTDFGLSDEELEGTHYSDTTEDENDLQRAGDLGTEFQGLRDMEMTDSKTRMTYADKQLAVSGILPDATSTTSNDDDATLVVDRSIDTGEMDSLDPGLEAWSPDSGDDTTGRVDNTNRDLGRDYDVDDDAVDTANELVNEGRTGDSGVDEV